MATVVVAAAAATVAAVAVAIAAAVAAVAAAAVAAVAAATTAVAVKAPDAETDAKHATASKRFLRYNPLLSTRERVFSCPDQSIAEGKDLQSKRGIYKGRGRSSRSAGPLLSKQLDDRIVPAWTPATRFHYEVAS